MQKHHCTCVAFIIQKYIAFVIAACDDDDVIRVHLDEAFLHLQQLDDFLEDPDRFSSRSNCDAVTPKKCKPASAAATPNTGGGGTPKMSRFQLQEVNKSFLICLYRVYP